MKTKYLSKTQERRKERTKTIIAIYKKRIANTQSKMALYEAIADELGISQWTVIKVINNYCRDGQTDRN